MNTKLYRISPKLKLGLNIVFFLFALLLLWATQSFSMPTQMLAIRKAEAEHCLDRGDWATTEDLKNTNFSNGGSWYLSRRGDEFYMALPTRQGAFWHISHAQRLPHLVPLYVSTSFNGAYGNHIWTYYSLIAAPDPATVRVELVQDGQIVDCVETAPGSGFWLGKTRSSESGSGSPLARAYDADGNLLGSIPP